MTQDVERLQTHFHPRDYRIHITPDYQNSSFAGTVTLTGELQAETSSITLHTADLTCHRAWINQETASVRVDQNKPHVHIETGSTLPSGPITLDIEFEGRIKDTMHGLYWSRFTYEEQAKYLLATQFEANHAREVFPCIDEPGAKAVFQLSLDTPRGHTAVSNTPIAEQAERENGDVYTLFEPTPHMSAYLLAFVVGELEYTESATSTGTTVRVYTTPGNSQHGGFALRTAAAALDFYNDYYEISYPLTKCDIVALPDFAAAAMENWGCITFREAVLLVDPDNTSMATKQLVANVIAHELTHQWFGNLVTMQWWNDLWLNEGFATWMANLAVDYIYPEWNIWEQFAGEDQIPALRLDSLKHSHPIEVPVHDPEEINEIFDAISYNKGAATLHMLHTYLGSEDFRRGLSRYLNRHAYENTQTHDLWEALAEVSGKPVQDFMSNWTQQSGYPLIQYEPTDTGLRLTQSRFQLLPAATQATDQVWYVPISAVGHEQTFLLDSPAATWEDTPPLPAKFNANRGGFFRVHYPEEDLQQLFGNLMQFPPLDRLGLIDDTFELAKAGYTNTATALSLLPHAAGETSDVVWDVIFLQLAQIQRVFGEDVLEHMYGKKLTDIQLQRLGWDKRTNETVFDSLLRPIILNLSARCHVDSVIEEAFRRFRSGDNVDPDIRRTVYIIVARNGGEDEFEALYSRHNDTDFDEEKLRLANALCSFAQTPLIERALDMIISEDVRKQEVRHWLAYLFSNPHAAQPTWQWMQENWQWLDDNFRGSHAFPDFPKLAARSFRDTAIVDEFERFFRGNVPDRSLDQAIENILIHANWHDRDERSVNELVDS